MKKNQNTAKINRIKDITTLETMASELENNNDDDVKQKLIVVLGMHRSGTSAITRGLQVLGVGLGNSLTPALEYNVKGLWEDTDFLVLNVHLLKAIGSDWDHIAAIGAEDLKVLRDQGYFLKAVELLNQKVINYPVFGFKDPRTAKLMPFWKEVFAHLKWDVGYVLAIRNPLSVTKSLAKRDDFDSEKSYLLWLNYVLESIKDTQGEKCVLLDYDRLMQSPKIELQRIADILDLKFNTDEFEIYQNQFLDTELRHSICTIDDLLLDRNCPKLVQEMYSALLEVASDKIKINDTNLVTKFDEWDKEFNSLIYTIKLVDKQSTRITSLTENITELNQILFYRDALITELKQLVTTRDEQIAQFYQSLASCETYITECETHIAELNRSLTESDAQISEFKQILVNRDEQIAGLNQILADRDKQISIFNQHVTNCSLQIDNLKQTISELYNSNSWKLTAPIRFLGKQLVHLKTILKQ